MTDSKARDVVEAFGPYEIYERLGVGGMASVHRAKKRGIEGFERVVALKRLLPNLAEDDSFVQSFVREARLASQLQHANIIQIYDLGRVDGIYYIAMELVRGRDLRQILKQTAYATGPMPAPMMLLLTQQLCDALDYAHTLSGENGEPLGLVHRDISPSNLLIAADGNLKVIDFGIAKATSLSLRTQSGRVKGKFAYMAPEAVQGQSLDRRSDIFSVGVVAYEMITARPLFASKSEFDTLRKITKLPVAPPSQHNPDCPPDLDDIILTALAKSPEERWQTAGAMHRALDHVAKKCALQTTNREIAEWLEWAQAQPLQSKRVRPRRASAAPPPKVKKPTLTSSMGPLEPSLLDDASIELVWGVSQEEHTAPTRQISSSATVETRQLRPAGQLQPAIIVEDPSSGSGPARALGSSRVPDGMPKTTMLGVAPPPTVDRMRLQRITGAPVPVAGDATGGEQRKEPSGPSVHPGAPPASPPPPVTRVRIHPPTMPKRVMPEPEPAPEPEEESSSLATILLKVALLLFLCAGAAAAGYFLVP